MIVDCHTYVWERAEQLGRTAPAVTGRLRAAGVRNTVDTERHFQATEPVDKTIVLGFRSYYLDAHVPNDYLARYVRQHPDRLVGFAGVDPSRPREAVRATLEAHESLGLKGIVVCPAAQDYHPASTQAMKIYAEAERLRMPVLFDQGLLMTPSAKMEYARPYLLDEVAREFPNLKIVISQLGYPWVEETIVLLAKHPNVYGDISGLMQDFWNSYKVLLSAAQMNVIDKLLFGSNYPFTSAAACIEALYSMNRFCQGTNLPTIPREQLRRIVERDTLAVLDIAPPSEPAAA